MPHPALGQFSFGACEYSFPRSSSSLLASGVRLIANLLLVRSSRSTLNQGPFPPWALPRFIGTMGPSDSWSAPRPLPSVRVRSSPHAPPGLPCCASFCARMLRPIPRWTGGGPWSIPSPTSLDGFPRIRDGSASTTPLSGPAQASLALRPACLLDLLSGPLSQGFAVAVARLPFRAFPRLTATEAYRPNSSGGTSTR